MFPGHETAPAKLLAKFLVPLSSLFCAAVLLVGFLGPPDLAEVAKTFYTLSYPNGDGTYGRGLLDLRLVAFSALGLTAARAVLAAAFSRPLARALGVKKSEVGKFVEQVWQFIWYLSAWCVGATLMHADGWDASLDFRQHPSGPPTSLRKGYYLVQLGFWIHMIPVTIIEPWRGDFFAMIAHHFITSGLVGVSYRINGLRFGTAVFTEQDFADILLPLAKLCKYSKMATAADTVFAAFAVSWFPTRHVIFCYLWYVVYQCRYTCPIENQVWAPERDVYFSPAVQLSFLVALGLFQCLMLFWFKAICGVVYRTLKKGHAEDTRSDSEDSDKED